MAETQTDLANYQSDHDLLIRVDTRMVDLIRSVDEMKVGTNEKIKDHERRLLLVEQDNAASTTWQRLLLTAISGLVIALGWFYLSYYNLAAGIDARIQRDITTNLENYSLIKN
jgi:hypothetical protein